MVTQGSSHGLWSNQSVRGQPLCGLCRHCDKDHLSHERPKELLHCKEGAFHKQWEMDEMCKHVSFPHSLINGQGVFLHRFFIYYNSRTPECCEDIAIGRQKPWSEERQAINSTQPILGLLSFRAVVSELLIVYLSK